MRLHFSSHNLPKLQKTEASLVEATWESSITELNKTIQKMNVTYGRL